MARSCQTPGQVEVSSVRECCPHHSASWASSHRCDRKLHPSRKLLLGCRLAKLLRRKFLPSCCSISFSTFSKVVCKVRFKLFEVAFQKAEIAAEAFWSEVAPSSGFASSLLISLAMGRLLQAALQASCTLLDAAEGQASMRMQADSRCSLLPNRSLRSGKAAPSARMVEAQ